MFLSRFRSTNGGHAVTDQTERASRCQPSRHVWVARANVGLVNRAPYSHMVDSRYGWIGRKFLGNMRKLLMGDVEGSLESNLFFIIWLDMGGCDWFRASFPRGKNWICYVFGWYYANGSKSEVKFKPVEHWKNPFGKNNFFKVVRTSIDVKMNRNIKYCFQRKQYMYIFIFNKKKIV